MTPVLEVSDLRIGFRQDGQVVPAVRGVSFTVGKGETVALVGVIRLANRSRRCRPSASVEAAEAFRLGPL